MKEECVLPLSVRRERVPQSTQFRSTWVVSSIQSLRAHGNFERYSALLPSSHREEILHAVVGSWMPIAVVRVHYAACEQLGLTLQEQLRMGTAVGERAQGSLLATVVKAARGAGVTPWTIIPQFDRLWHRGVDGGAVAAYKLGPKEARVEFMGCELFEIDYFRNAFRGVLQGIMTLFSRVSYVHELKRAPDEATFRFQWV